MWDTTLWHVVHVVQVVHVVSVRCVSGKISFCQELACGDGHWCRQKSKSHTERPSALCGTKSGNLATKEAEEVQGSGFSWTSLSRSFNISLKLCELSDRHQRMSAVYGVYGVYRVYRVCRVYGLLFQTILQFLISDPIFWTPEDMTHENMVHQAQTNIRLTCYLKDSSLELKNEDVEYRRRAAYSTYVQWFHQSTQSISECSAGTLALFAEWFKRYQSWKPDDEYDEARRKATTRDIELLNM